MTRKKEEEPSLQTNPFFAYDRAISRLLACRVGATLEPVPITFGTARREFADQEAINPENERAKKGGDGLSAERANKTVPEAVMSVRRIGEIQFDVTRFNTGRDQPINLSEDRKSWSTMIYPLPYIFLYQVDVRSKHRPTLNQIIVQVSLRFKKPLIWMPVNWGPPFGNRNVEAGLIGQADTSVLEQIDANKERQLRHTFTLRVVGWLLGRKRTVPSVLKVIVRTALVPIAGELDDQTVWEIIGDEVTEGNTATGEVTVHHEVPE